MSIIAMLQLRNNKYIYVHDDEVNDLRRTPFITQCIPGDAVRIEDGEVKEIVGRNTQYTVAIVRGFGGGMCFLYCPLFGEIYNPSLVCPEAQMGERMLIRVFQTGVEVVRMYGHHSDRKKDWDVIHDIYTHTYNAYSELKRVEQDLLPLYTKGHQDQRGLPTFTIDPATSKDFDDAVSVVGSTVYVHIVDIHSQMPFGSAMDIEAARLGFTLYLPEGNHNIVPDEMAEGAWSLIAGVDRRVITIEIRFNEDLNVAGYDIYPATICVKNRWSYETAPAMPFLASIAGAAKRNHFTIPQIGVRVDKAGMVASVSQTYNTDVAHRIIETLMVLANMLVSRHLQEMSPMYRLIPQRFHTKLKALPEEGAEPTGDEIVNSFLAIKSFAVASYEVDKGGHFGLGLSTYTHFTSPIRRYFDVVLHRILAGYVFEEDGMREMLAWLNHRERLVDQLQGLYNDSKLIAGGGIAIGDTWDITVTRVMRAGVYYLYTPLMIDGFVHVSALSPGGAVRWVLDGEGGKERLVSQCGTHELAVGSVLRCTVASIDMMKCTFALRV